MRQDQSILERCYKDKKGNVVLAQFPNAPLITWIVATIAARLLPDSALAPLLGLVAFGAIFTWAWLETFHGVTYVRRMIGLIVMIAAIFNRL